MIDYILKASQDQHKTVTIMYQGSKDITQRNIRVLEITGDKVKAICYLRHEPRIFKKDGILAAGFARQN